MSICGILNDRESYYKVLEFQRMMWLSQGEFF